MNLTGVNLSELMEGIPKVTAVGGGKNNVITVATDPEVHIIADEVRMEQLLTNLVKNALQFTENGQVEISARRRKSVVLSVETTASGLIRTVSPRV